MLGRVNVASRKGHYYLFPSFYSVYLNSDSASTLSAKSEAFPKCTVTKRQKLLSRTKQWSFKTVGIFKGSYNSSRVRTKKKGKKRGKFLCGKVSSRPQKISIILEPQAPKIPHHPFLSWTTLEVICLWWLCIAENSILLG